MMTSNAAVRQFVWALALSGLVFLIQLVGALYSGSLSLLSNAGHLFTDVGSLGLALYAAKVGQNPPTEQLSYGYGRSGILAAFVNGLVLAGVAAALIVAGVFRLAHPQPVHSTIMIAVTVVTLVLNLTVTRTLHADHDPDVNRRAAYWHALGDSLSSVGILAAALLIHWTHWPEWDSLAAIAVGLFILWSSWAAGRPSLLILMEAAPAGARPEDVRALMLQHPAVHDVHHVHVWSLAPGYHALSAHVRLETDTIREGQRVIEELSQSLKESHHIDHVTIQIEAEAHSPAPR